MHIFLRVTQVSGLLKLCTGRYPMKEFQDSARGPQSHNANLGLPCAPDLGRPNNLRHNPRGGVLSQFNTAISPTQLMRFTSNTPRGILCISTDSHADNCRWSYRKQSRFSRPPSVTPSSIDITCLYASAGLP